MATAADVRNLFEELVREEHVRFHPLDMERVKDDDYILRVLKHVENNPKEAADLLFDIFEWRKTIRANDITEISINMDYIKEGLMFPRGRDVDGCLLLILKCKLHLKKLKDMEETKRCIIYWFDRVEREENGRKITLFLDFDNCGLINVDMELTNFLIMLFKYYYPNFLNYILIYQLPWLMSHGFKLLKSALPAKAGDKMKFVNQQTLKDFVLPHQALTSWGGLDDYIFEFVPESETEEICKKVTFAQECLDGTIGSVNLSPDHIVFRTQKGYVTGQFTIQNVDNSSLSFRIRTTSPEKFRVMPTCGILTTGMIYTIDIRLQQGYQLRPAYRDKFAVQVVRIPHPELNMKQLSDIWSKTPLSQIQCYSMKCLFPERDIMMTPADHYEAVAEVLETIKKDQEKLQNDMNYMKMMQFYIILTIIVFVGTGLSMYLFDFPKLVGGSDSLKALQESTLRLEQLIIIGFVSLFCLYHLMAFVRHYFK